jgi:hypothetical protein
MKIADYKKQVEESKKPSKLIKVNKKRGESMANP